MINELIQLRAGDSPGLEHFLRAHLVLQGINPDVYTEQSPDDAKVERRLLQMIQDFQRKGA